jgi:hypothetical protein
MKKILCSDKEIGSYIHKLNNLLTIIQGNAELIKITTGVREEADDILISCQKSLEILEHLRGSSRLQ